MGAGLRAPAFDKYFLQSGGGDSLPDLIWRVFVDRDPADAQRTDQLGARAAARSHRRGVFDGDAIESLAAGPLPVRHQFRVRKFCDTANNGRAAVWNRIGADGDAGVAGRRAAVPRGEAAVFAVASSVHLARVTDRRIFLLVHCWIIAGSSADGISGGVLLDCESLWSVGAARSELRRFRKHGDSVDWRNCHRIAGCDQRRILVPVVCHSPFAESDEVERDRADLAGVFMGIFAYGLSE